MAPEFWSENKNTKKIVTFVFGNQNNSRMSTEKYVLQEVTTPAQEREWLDFPKKKIYKGNRNWVCPLDIDIEAVFDPAKNEYKNDGAIHEISADSSRVKVLVIPTNEELVIARETASLI